MHPRRFLFAPPSGFTLIEIAIVLMIVGLLSVMGVRMFSSANEGLRARVTRQNLEYVKQALQAFMVRTGRLPCPAIETLATSDTAYGIEAPTPGTCTGTTAIGTTAAFRGVVPWKTLGMSTETAFDAWGRQLTYVVTTGPPLDPRNATNLTSSTLSGMRGALYLHSTAPVVAALPATGNQINACSTTAGDNSCNGFAVVVLVAFGSNGSGAYNVGGVRGPLPTSATELENTDTTISYVLAEPSGTFDDIVVAYSPNDLLGPLYLQGMLRPPETLVAERARQVVSLVAADAVNTRTGSSPNITYNLPSSVSLTPYTFDVTKFDMACDNRPPPLTGPAPTVQTMTGDAAQVLDPWGRVFRYARASDAITSGESCPTPMVIISLGPDGTLSTSDDMVYYSSLAEWKSIFEKSGW